MKALTEAQVEREPDAVAGRALLEERLSRYGEAEVAAFWAAVRRCYAGAAGTDAAGSR
ncbi:hypothetical protein [Methylobacterium sp. sgz302541]|uniref:hypothetical protein n=1 Tax=unclassified Methylobacterium TaxID=2615210 RepID=UPI003D332D8A